MKLPNEIFKTNHCFEIETAFKISDFTRHFHLIFKNKISLIIIFLNMGPSRPLFRSLSSFSHHKSITKWKSVDGVLGIQTRGRRMLGADETTELRRPPKISLIIGFGFFHKKLPNPNFLKNTILSWHMRCTVWWNCHKKCQTRTIDVLVRLDTNEKRLTVMGKRRWKHFLLKIMDS